MPKRFVSWMIGGPQGSGINVAAETLAKAFSRGGLYVFANIEYHSNIMGKHSYYRVRVSEEPVHAPVDEVHLLAALDEETLFGDHHHNPEFPTAATSMRSSRAAGSSTTRTWGTSGGASAATTCACIRSPISI
ncbi:MAG: hypothetical protein C4314_01315 [Thermoflexus sp.]